MERVQAAPRLRAARSASATPYCDPLLRPLTATPYWDHLLGPPAGTTCWDHLLGPLMAPRENPARAPARGSARCSASGDFAPRRVRWPPGPALPPRSR